MKNYVKEYKGYKVPEGAKYYGDGSHHFYNENKTKFYNTELDEWGALYSPYYADNAIELPEAPQEWMPEVGEECEALDALVAHPVYCLIRVKGFYNEQVWVTSEAGVELVLNTRDVRFRPPKTAEEKKRDAFHLSVIDACMGIHKDDFNIDEIAGALYRAQFTAPKAGE